MLESFQSPKIQINDDAEEKRQKTSGSDTFNKLLTRKFSSYRKPIVNRPKADDHRETKYLVEIRIIFIRIGEIDSMRETFFAEAFMQAKWIDKHASIGNYDPAKNWNPDIIVEVIELKKYKHFFLLKLSILLFHRML